MNDTKKLRCDRCDGTGWVLYSTKGTPHWKVCRACCLHEAGWFEMSPLYSGYAEGKDNGCCRSGCGALRRDVIRGESNG